jgi:succinylglutamate desuccinylase
MDYPFTQIIINTVNNFSVSQLKPTPVTVNVDGKVITLEKDSLRSTAKIKSGCYDYIDGKQGSSYSYAVLSGAEGEYQVIFNITDDDFDLKTKVKRPINEVRISYDAICQ